ncbi:MAG: hypothetical protein WKG00_10285 [Polyangiaceae bacterium]
MSGAVAFEQVTATDWRALVEKQLAGKPFDKVLVHEAVAGITVQPLYTEAPGEAVAARQPAAGPFRVCVRVEPASAAALAEEVAGGAEALWVPFAQASFGALATKPPGACGWSSMPRKRPSPTSSARSGRCRRTAGRSCSPSIPSGARRAAWPR